MGYKLGISLLTYNHFELTHMTLKSLYESIAPDSDVILDVQDDGSDEINQMCLRRFFAENSKGPFENVEVTFDNNKGLIRARNESYERLLMQGCQYIAVIHNDMMFSRLMFDLIVDRMDADRTIGILAAETVKSKPTQEELDKIQADANVSVPHIFRGNNHPAIMRTTALLRVFRYMGLPSRRGQ